jgi:hypothetical protein
MYRFEMWIHKGISREALDKLTEFLKAEFGTTVEEKDIKA